METFNRIKIALIEKKQEKGWLSNLGNRLVPLANGVRIQLNQILKHSTE